MTREVKIFPCKNKLKIHKNTQKLKSEHCFPQQNTVSYTSEKWDGALLWCKPNYRWKTEKSASLLCIYRG